jgi:hypothetical protein
MADEFDGVAAVAEAIAAGEFDADVDAYMENAVVPTWVSNSPEDTGDYKQSIKVTKPAAAGKGRVTATVPYANLIEYGTNDTPEFAPVERTIAQLNGNGQS